MFKDSYTIWLILLLLWSSPASAGRQWASLRGGGEGAASIAYHGPKTLNEWHYTYKSGRRYTPGLAVWASPALAVVAGNPMAFIGGYDQTLHALDLSEKRAVWRKITNGEIQAAPAVGAVDGEDVVFWGSADRTVYAYAAFNGKRLWTKELVPGASTLGAVHMSSPLATDDGVYICCFAYDKSLPRSRQQGILYRLDIRTGEIRWKHEVSPGFLSSPVGFQVRGARHIVVAARRGLVQCFDVSGARPVRTWSFQMPHEVMGSPAVAAEGSSAMLFLGSKYGNLIAIDAVTGKEAWQRMAGNWIDNTACIGDLDGEKAVFVGSHDYRVYAFNAGTGKTLWKKAVGGEVFSAPSFFHMDGKPRVAVAALDNHLYLLDARTGDIITSYFTGNPIWDKLSKGENLWGSPAVVAAEKETVIVHGSFDDTVYILPLAKECSLEAMAHSSRSLWLGLLTVFLLFSFIVLPLVILIPQKKPRHDQKF